VRSHVEAPELLRELALRHHLAAAERLRRLHDVEPLVADEADGRNAGGRRVGRQELERAHRLRQRKVEHDEPGRVRGGRQRLDVPHGLDGHAERLRGLPDLRNEQQVADDIDEHGVRVSRDGAVGQPFRRGRSGDGILRAR
jgi:hypothetical protein